MPPQPKKVQSKTVSFWRLLDLGTGQPVPQVDWQAQLQALQVRGSQTLDGITGEAVLEMQQHRLVLSRDRGTAPRQQDRTSGRKNPMRTAGPGWDVIEEAFVSFMDVGNVFAYVRSSIAAPPPSAVGAWLSRAHIPPGRTWKVEPLIDQEQYQAVRRAPELLWVEVVARPAADVEADGGLLGSILGMRRLGDVKVEIRVSTDRGADNAGTRRRIKTEAVDLLEEIAAHPGLITKAVAKVPGIVDPIDLIEHHLTAKGSISIPLGGRNRSITEERVFNLMDAQANRLYDAVRRAVGAQ
jgi:hypothetical protein